MEAACAYVDESGNPADAREQNFALGGLAVFERQTYWIAQQLDALEMELFGPLDPMAPAAFPRPVEFHA